MNNNNPSGLYRHTGFWILLIGSTALTLGAFFYPLFAHIGCVGTSIISKAIYTPVCHQFPERSFHLFGYSVSVCQRCIMGYIGFALMVYIYPLILRIKTRRLTIVVLGICFIPITLDWGLDVISIIENTALSRSVTGFLGGAGMGYIGVSAWVEATTPEKSLHKQ